MNWTTTVIVLFGLLVLPKCSARRCRKTIMAPCNAKTRLQPFYSRQNSLNSIEGRTVFGGFIAGPLSASQQYELENVPNGYCPYTTISRCQPDVSVLVPQQPHFPVFNPSMWFNPFSQLQRFDQQPESVSCIAISPNDIQPTESMIQFLECSGNPLKCISKNNKYRCMLNRVLEPNQIIRMQCIGNGQILTCGHRGISEVQRPSTFPLPPGYCHIPSSDPVVIIYCSQHGTFVTCFDQKFRQVFCTFVATLHTGGGFIYTCSSVDSANSKPALYSCLPKNQPQPIITVTPPSAICSSGGLFHPPSRGNCRILASQENIAVKCTGMGSFTKCCVADNSTIRASCTFPCQMQPNSTAYYNCAVADPFHYSCEITDCPVTKPPPTIATVKPTVTPTVKPTVKPTLPSGENLVFCEVEQDEKHTDPIIWVTCDHKEQCNCTTLTVTCAAVSCYPLPPCKEGEINNFKCSKPVLYGSKTFGYSCKKVVSVPTGMTPTPTERTTKKSTEKPTESSTERKTEKYTERPTEKSTERQTEKYTERPTEKSTERQTEKYTERPTERPTKSPSDDYIVCNVDFFERKSDPKIWLTCDYQENCNCTTYSVTCDTVFCFGLPPCVKGDTINLKCEKPVELTSKKAYKYDCKILTEPLPFAKKAMNKRKQSPIVWIKQNQKSQKRVD